VGTIAIWRNAAMLAASTAEGRTWEGTLKDFAAAYLVND